jgi:hypothetical protein
VDAKTFTSELPVGNRFPVPARFSRTKDPNGPTATLKEFTLDILLEDYSHQ